MSFLKRPILQNDVYCKSTLRICSETNQGMRKYMEDEVSVVIDNKEEAERSAFIGVFDGHGGKEAAIFARDKLYANIKEQTGFNDNDPEKVKDAIKEGFIKTHWDMFRVLDTWPKRKDGQDSTSGTTATIAIVRGNKLYIAHVGDSAAVIATKEENDAFMSTDLTIDHKPENIQEKTRIESLGGRVASSSSVPRVVWKRAVKNHSPINSDQPVKYEYVPFLAVSRALGDLWSYDNVQKEFIVSPVPDIQCMDIIPGRHKFVVLASDGLWGVMNGSEVVNSIKAFESQSKCKSSKRNCSQQLVKDCLGLWNRKRSRADNISAIVVFFDDEFDVASNYSDDTDAADADTDVISDYEDETPPLSTANSDSNSSLVRQLAFPRPRRSLECNLPPSNVDSKPKDSAGSDVQCHSKRKLKEQSSSVNTSPKKLRISPSVLLPNEEDSHQSNVITVLSAESLYDLQLDEDPGFADDESETMQRDVKPRLSRGKRTNDALLKSAIPIPQEVN